ncbi:MAG: family 10 glycosylhydrolase [Bacteroides sp.]|nr:family 10 glycosylhydrolase [Bacteroides sp.]MBD5336135.1 family 10 glycosylhydrolase [Bacteroides sp.]
MNLKSLFLTAALLCGSLAGSLSAQTNPKREFRGAWLHIIGQSQYMNKTTEQNKKYIIDQLNKLQAAGCNAVIFQVRPTADAFYPSELEPWTAWAAGKRGKAPYPAWDPMQFTLDEAHKRGMEFHAWLNPYRVTSDPKEVLPASHPAIKNPERFVRYGGKLYFDPALGENRDFICSVVDDILDRYDVDGIHIDDYFYPYPEPGKKFNDDASYAKLGNGMNRNDWRRHNVNLLIEQLYGTIKAKKPWVRFGVSPFGIWRNKKNDPRGSESNGLQNYDDLYADVLLWAENGWVDYLAPQLYWSLDKTVAPSRHLAKWWNDNVHGADVYIGTDVRQTMTTADTKAGKKDELDTKIKLSRELPNVGGNIWWHGYWVTDNLNGVADRLASDYQSTLALPPVYGDDRIVPEKPPHGRVTKEGDKMFLSWDLPEVGSYQKETDPVRYAVYDFFPGEEVNLSDPEAIISITSEHKVHVADKQADVEGHTYAVTSIDRMNRESVPLLIKVK